MAAAAPRSSIPLVGKAMLVSFIFHLSAITVFSIVIYFPKQDLHFYRLAFVEEPAEMVVADAGPSLVDRLTQPRPAPVQFALPEVSFDPLVSDDNGPLRVRGHSLFEETPEDRPDSWQVFGEGIQKVRSSLLGIAGVPPLRLAGGSASDSVAPSASPNSLDLGPGLACNVEWRVAARELIYWPPALFQARPVGTVEIFVTVDASGAVSSAVAMTAEPTPFENEAAAFLRRCRFAPAEGGARTANASVRFSRVDEAAP